MTGHWGTPKSAQRAGFPEAEVDPVFHAIVSRMQQPFVVLSDDLTVLFANPAFYRHFHVSREETEGRLIYDLGNRQWNIPRLRRLLEQVLTENDSVGGFRIEHEFEQIGRRHMLVDANRIEVAGEPDRILLAISDVTELEGHQEFQEKLIDAVREGLLVLDGELRVERVNESFGKIFGVSQEGAKGRLVYELGGGEFDLPELRKLLEDILPSESAFDDFEVEGDFNSIGRRFLRLNARRIDHLDLILLAIRDVTEQRRHEEQRQVVVRELHHRVKNILANVSAIGRQTRRHSATVEEYADAFEGRLAALSRVHDMITSNGHEGAYLRRIVCLELHAIGATEGKDFDVDGPAIELEPPQAQALSLAIHELVTNAAKHGALKTRGGRIHAAWKKTESNDEARVELTWRESGVQIPEQAREKSFGSRMIQESLPRMLAGRVDLQYHPDGIECRIEFPLR